jgi:hypothetical protein
MIPAKHRRTAYVVFGFVIGVWLVTFVTGVILWCTSTTTDQYGQFGDLFGVINALFSGLALSGIALSLILQREDIDESLKSQREAAAAERDAADALRESAVAQTRQSRIASLAAALEAKRLVVEVLNSEVEKEIQNLPRVPIYAGGQPVNPTDFRQQVKSQMMAIQNLLDQHLIDLEPSLGGDRPPTPERQFQERGPQ